MKTREEIKRLRFKVKRIVSDLNRVVSELYNAELLSSPEKKEEELKWDIEGSIKKTAETLKNVRRLIEKEEVEGWRSDVELKNDIIKAKIEMEKEEPTQEFNLKDTFTYPELYEMSKIFGMVGNKWLQSKIEKLLK